MQAVRKASLILQDGSRYDGYSFGYEQSTSGEVVFNTAMNGYNESLTDPSYKGQIMVMTYPLVGNYGVPSREKDSYGLPLYMESDCIHMNGIIVSDYSQEYSHWNAQESLSDYLKEEKVVGIAGIDTRALAKHIREYGTMNGKIIFDNEKEESIPFAEPSRQNLVAEVSTKEVITYGQGKKRIVLVDCGVKANIIRKLITSETTVIRVPWDYDFHQLEYEGLFISNGPGSPEVCNITVDNIRKAYKQDKPIWGICMGHQLMALAAGGKIYKLKHGHHSHNQPVRRTRSNECFITSQNHNFAVDSSSLGTDWYELYTNLNDGSNEGISHKSKPFFSTQFHPEACGGPTDTMFIFDEFLCSL
ncbi:carbamoyl phosphate synthase small subunit [Porphyromonas crevioricanis]|uniref:Carbamoyl phosphate synthase small chain n=2 Tax=Porphyromonas crevioricanis TaxID=393921 RepID=A0A0A2FF89_9PORP|nr:glutamine-hydrolyzing carbamoyl-phosphate synthase small subunit [Porphyromonas crevioricanis]KGN88705.1 carbamoyl phosphate synthase small subunit [Porphyromonas crevioricanis]SJZ89853.1 carbamoyl-phosphate synthase small subunit [Porphyromonas crevioricanis]SQH73683.1 Carbamoyl-phosphate synthase small chain [Porphyromonas crevioricanis]GAD05396.1 carbamoyl-phosphate synthase small chain [Porphyromonas crevioricanis JCM 15906]GAD07620.1 carbamoyl-phosphate synthase small chain [Porphyromo